MILSGRNCSATWRAKSLITDMGMSAPRYQRGGFSFLAVPSFFTMLTFYHNAIFCFCSPGRHLIIFSATDKCLHRGVIMTRAKTEYRYEKLTWPEINDAVDLGKVCIVPCGAV